MLLKEEQEKQRWLNAALEENNGRRQRRLENATVPETQTKRKRSSSGTLVIQSTGSSISSTTFHGREVETPNAASLGPEQNSTPPEMDTAGQRANEGHSMAPPQISTDALLLSSDEQFKVFVKTLKKIRREMKKTREEIREELRTELLEEYKRNAVADSSAKRITTRSRSRSSTTTKSRKKGKKPHTK